MLRLLFSFKGRISRAKFWIFYLVGCFVIGMAGFALIFAAHLLISSGTRPPWPLTSHWSLWDIPMAAIAGFFFYVAIAVVVKRLHDRNKSAWWLLFYYGVPITSFIILRLTGYLPQATLQPHWVQIALFLINTAIIWWYLIELLFLPGTKGDNRFGPDPRVKNPLN